MKILTSPVFLALLRTSASVFKKKPFARHYLVNVPLYSDLCV